MKEEETYNQVFDESYNRDLYVACILIDRQVQNYLKVKSGLPNDVRRDIQYYVEMLVAGRLAKKATLDAQDVVGLFPASQSDISEEILAWACQTALKTYNDLGGTDKVSKGSDLVAKLKGLLKESLAAL